MKALLAVSALVVLAAGSASAVTYFQDFDSYASGSQVTSVVPNWEKWGQLADPALITNAQALSPANSLAIMPDSDLVTTSAAIGAYTSGLVVVEFDVYVAASHTGTLSLDIHGDYADGGANQTFGGSMFVEGTELRFRDNPGADVADTWGHVKMSFDLDADTFNAEYNNGTVQITGTAAFTNDLNATDFWDDTGSEGVYIDNYMAGRPAHPGDANLDGKVSVGDLGILAANYGLDSGANWAKGDFNGDYKVSVGDLGILAANYGFTSAVPEPVTLALLGLGALALRRRSA